MKYSKLSYDYKNFPSIDGVGEECSMEGIQEYDDHLRPKTSLMISRPSFMPQWDYFNYYKRAKKYKHTDFVSNSGGRSLIVSHKLFHLLKGFNVVPFVSRSCEIKFKNNFYAGFYLLDFYNYNLEFIDYSKTLFYYLDSHQLNYRHQEVIKESDKVFVQFSSFKEFELAWFNKGQKRICSDSILMNIKFDFLILKGISNLDNSVFYISKEFREALYKNNIINFKFKKFYKGDALIK